MKNKLVYIVLAASLGFNIFFSLGYLSAKRDLKNAKNLRQRIELISGKLSLSDEQKKELLEIVKFSRKKSEQLKNERKKVTLLFKSEFKKESPDIDTLKDALHRIEKKQKEFRAEAALEWRDFYASLDEKQKNKAKAILSRYPEIAGKLLIPIKRKKLRKRIKNEI